jgi:hypothetical protein
MRHAVSGATAAILHLRVGLPPDSIAQDACAAVNASDRSIPHSGMAAASVFHASVVSLKFVEEQKQILRLTTPNSTPQTKTRLRGPRLKNVRGPVRSS